MGKNKEEVWKGFLKTATCSIPHPNKRHKGGEDASYESEK